MRIEVAAEKLDGDGARVADKLAEPPDGIFAPRPRGGGQNLDAVAGGDDQPLAHDLAVHERAQTLGARLVAERQALAHLYRRGLVVESDENYRHRDYLKTWKPPSATAPTKVQRTSEKPPTPSHA